MDLQKLKLISKLTDFYGNDYQDIIDNYKEYSIDFIRELTIEDIEKEYEDVISDITDIRTDFKVGEELEDIYFVSGGIEIDWNGDRIYCSDIEDFASCYNGKEVVEDLLYGRITLENDCVDYIDNTYDGNQTEANCSEEDFDNFIEENNNLDNYVEETADEWEEEIVEYFEGLIEKDSVRTKRKVSKV